QPPYGPPHGYPQQQPAQPGPQPQSGGFAAQPGVPGQAAGGFRPPQQVPPHGRNTTGPAGVAASLAIAFGVVGVVYDGYLLISHFRSFASHLGYGSFVVTVSYAGNVLGFLCVVAALVCGIPVFQGQGPGPLPAGG